MNRTTRKNGAFLSRLACHAARGLDPSFLISEETRIYV
jgi:hypothetical protein